MRYDPAEHDGCVICRRSGGAKGRRQQGLSAQVRWGLAGVASVALGVGGYFLFKQVNGVDLDGARATFADAVSAARARDTGRFLPLLSDASRERVGSGPALDTAMVLVAQMKGAEGEERGGAVVFERQVYGADGASNMVRISVSQEDGQWRLSSLGDASRMFTGAAGELSEGAPRPEDLEPEVGSPAPELEGEAEILWEANKMTLPLNTEAETSLQDLHNTVLSFEAPSGNTDALVLRLDLTQAGRWAAGSDDRNILSRVVGGLTAAPYERCNIELAAPMTESGGVASGRIGPCQVSFGNTAPAGVAPIQELSGEFRVRYRPTQAREDAPPGDIPELALEETGAGGAGGDPTAAPEGELGVAGSGGAAPAAPVVIGWPRGAVAFNQALASDRPVLVYFCSSENPCSDFERAVLAEPSVQVKTASMLKVQIDPDGTAADRQAQYAVSTSAASPSVWVIKKGGTGELVGSASDTPEAFISALEAALQ